MAPVASEVRTNANTKDPSILNRIGDNVASETELRAVATSSGLIRVGIDVPGRAVRDAGSAKE